MKVRVTVTVDIDPDDWVMTYGCPREEVRDDVRRYVLNVVQQSAGIQECGREG